MKTTTSTPSYALQAVHGSLRLAQKAPVSARLQREDRVIALGLLCCLLLQIAVWCARLF